MRILRSQYMRNRTLAANSDNTNTTDHMDICNKKLDVNAGPNNKTQEISAEEIFFDDCPQTTDCGDRNDSSTSISTSTTTNIQLHFDYIDKRMNKLNVIVEFIKMDTLWWSSLYRSYENDLWHRTQRFYGIKKINKRNLWYYHCNLCKKMYRQFDSIKSHLNMHFNCFPYICKLCGTKYTTRKLATKHLKYCHKLTKEQWDDHLIS